MFSVTLMTSLLLQMSRQLHLYLAWTVKSDESIRFLERSSDSKSFQWKLCFKNLHCIEFSPDCMIHHFSIIAKKNKFIQLWPPV